MSDTAVIDKVVERTKLSQPSHWNVVLHNDDRTSMEFVIVVLMQIFHKSAEDSATLMFTIHENGRGVAGTYTKEVAEYKRDMTLDAARLNGYPLHVSLEKN